HMLVSTGAITLPDYHSAKYVQGRTDEKAAAVHKIGALLIEKSNGDNIFPYVGDVNGEFNLRHVEFIEESQGFYDVGRFYSAKSVEPLRPLAVVLGDIHVGSTHQRLLEAFRNQILTLKPREVILHDLMDGYSISHHERDLLITMAKKAETGELDLKAEIENVISFVNSMLAIDPQLLITIVHSNHNFWLYRWLQDGEYIGDAKNDRIGHLLAVIARQGKDPLETVLKYGLSDFDQATGERKYLIMPVSAEARLAFTHPGESKKVGPRNRRVELALHGHAGAGGRGGSMLAFGRGNSGVARGHTHTVSRVRNDVNIGTFTHLKLGYSMDGMSNWVQALGLIGPHGEKQILVFRDGEFYADPAGAKRAPEEFFVEGYPKLIPNNDAAPGPGDFDQHGGGEPPRRVRRKK
ncbi:MAG TPA: hypothetical protein PLH57_11525, partial [Oligoflexia bacterium]|nr:hypothetical protein [Oligoflexia bacterium]